ncbi:MAG: HypC/HybG/HupF family hydrogenase formation chaperone [Solirubrobacteraceae bacterium]
MCLGIPGQIVEWVDRDTSIAKADVSGVVRAVNLGLLDGAEVGDWVLIHVGFAMSLIDAEEAASTLEFLRLLGDPFEEELSELKGSRIE